MSAMYSRLSVCQECATQPYLDVFENPQQAYLTNSNLYPRYLAAMDSANEISIHDAEQEWEDNRGHPEEHRYRRRIVGQPFDFDGESLRPRETHTHDLRPTMFRRLSKEERRAQAQYLSIPRPRSAGSTSTRLSAVETIEHNVPEMIAQPSTAVNQESKSTRQSTMENTQEARSEESSANIDEIPTEAPAQKPLPAWASGRIEDISWSDEENEDLGIYATAGSKQREYTVSDISDSEGESEPGLKAGVQSVAPAVDVSEAVTPSQSNPTSPNANTTNNFTLDADDIECQLLEDPAAFRIYIEEINTQLQIIFSSTKSAEQTTREAVEQAETARQKLVKEHLAIEATLENKLTHNSIELEGFKETYNRDIDRRDKELTKLEAQIAKYQFLEQRNSASTKQFAAIAAKKAAKVAEDKYQATIAELKAGWKILKEERQQFQTQGKALEGGLKEAKSLIREYERDNSDLRGEKEYLEAQFEAERSNLTHLESVNEELQAALATKEGEITAIRLEQEEEMAGTRAAKEKEIAAIRAIMEDQKEEIKFKDEQLGQLADLTISEVELREQVRDLQAQVVEKDQQLELVTKQEEDKQEFVVECAKLQQQISTLEDQLAVQTQTANTDLLEACEMEKQALQDEITQLQTKVARLNDELTLSFAQAEEFAALKIEHTKVQDELKKAKETTPAPAAPASRSERLQHAMEAVSKMRKAISTLR